MVERVETEEEAKAWLMEMGLNCKLYKFDKDQNVVDVEGDVDLHGRKLTSIKVQFRNVDGYFSCSGNRLTSLRGAPKVCEDFYCHDNRLTRLKNIHKKIDRIGGDLWIPGVRSHILGVLKIRDLKRVILGSRDNGEFPKLQSAIEIVNKHLENKPNPNGRDIHTAQEQLIEAGLSEYAQL